jgi:4-alpha-glucanotransferase
MSDLDRLAEIVGIEPYYWDIFGNRRETSDATKRALIAGMGLPAGTDDEVAASLKRETEEPWRKPLPPCAVLVDTEPLAVPVSLPEELAAKPVAWTVIEEGGLIHTGEGVLEGEAERRDLGDARFVRGSLVIPRPLPLGYHTLEIRAGSLRADTRLIVAPERCVAVEERVPDGRAWGIGVQVYSLRSERDWGIGDFDALGRFAEEAARLGAGLVGLNPLHQLFPAEPRACGPYSPSSRSFLNIAYIAVESVPEFAGSAEAKAMVAGAGFAERLAAAHAAEFVDYPAVTALKMPVLAVLHRAFRKRPADDPRAAAFGAFVSAGGEALRRAALFEALQERFVADSPDFFAWQTWPEVYRDPAGPAVAAFAKDNEERVSFFQWAQFEADRQLGEAAERGRKAGLALGFYRDLAVAVNPCGGAAWFDRQALVQGVAVGSPPDAFNLMGQNWGLSPLSPLGLRKTGYAAFINAMRANMRHAGALRIDHVMALKHLFLLPSNGVPGAYVEYPFQDMVRIVALESRRAGCVIIGEDLGTVPDGFRPAMADAGVLSYRVLYFERNPDGSFKSPNTYPERALATVSTHDLAPFRGFWNERDLGWRCKLGLYPDEEAKNRDKWDRGVDRWRLFQALNTEGLRPPRYPNDEGNQPWSRELAEAVHRYLARTPSQIVMLQIEDALSEEEQPNLPGTVDEHPNWRRRLPIKVETVASDEGIAALANAVRSGRQPPA